MHAELNGVYTAGPAEPLVVVFDLRVAGAVGRLHAERAFWRERDDIQALDENHFALVVGVRS